MFDRENVFQSQQDPEDDNGWAVSYGDVMSLLLAFFVMMMSTATVNQAKYDEIKKYLSGDVKSQNELKQMEIEVKESIASAGLSDAVEVVRDDLGVQITLRDDLVFSTGSATLNPRGKKALERLFIGFHKIPDKYRFEIEGHTDDAPINGRKFKSNWELSTARGLTILHEFFTNDFKESRFSVQGFADKKPIVDNRDKSGNPIGVNRAKNRRVVIKIR